MRLTIQSMRKFVLPLSLSLIILFSSTVAVITFQSAHAQVSSHPNLFVSAENTMSNNYFGGPQVVEVVVSDPNIKLLNQAYGEPVVTVNGKRLRMAQATDGNWYAFFADRNQAERAGKTAPLDGHGLNFGWFCGPNTLVDNIKQGLSFDQTKGFTIARNPYSSAKGPQSPSAFSIGPIGDCEPLTNTAAPQGEPATEHVVRENKTLNSNGNGFAATVGYEAIWPIIQLYDFSAIPSQITVDYSTAGGDQIVNLNFDRIPSPLIGSSISLNQTTVDPRGQVMVNINDWQLNVDPTDINSWTWGTNPSNTTLYYQAFDRNGNPDADGTPAMYNLMGNLTSLMFNHNGNLTVNLGVQGTQVATFVTNDLQQLNLNGGTRSISAASGPMTIAESGVNTGVFRNYDEVNVADLNILPDPTHSLSGKTASISYNKQSATVTVSNSSPTPQEVAISDLTKAKTLVYSDKLLDAGDLLWNTTDALSSIADPQKRATLSYMLYNEIYSYLIGATPSSLPEYPLQCPPSYINATIVWGLPQVTFSYSDQTSQPYYPHATVIHTENSVCLPYLMRNGVLTSAVFNETANSLTLGVSPKSDGQIIIPIDRSIIDSKDSAGHDTLFLVNQSKTHQENNTATIRLLTVPFTSTTHTIQIIKSQPPLCLTCINLNPSKRSYNIGEPVLITGNVNPTILTPGVPVTLTLKYNIPRYTIVVGIAQEIPDNKGDFQDTISTGFKLLGTYTVYAQYGSYSAKTSFNVTPFVNTSCLPLCFKAVTTTAITLTSTSVYVGSLTMATATVTGSSPTGTVSFSSGGTCWLNVIGMCSVTFIPSSPGPVTIKGNYSGDDNNLPSNSTATLTVNKAPTTKSRDGSTTLELRTYTYPLKNQPLPLTLRFTDSMGNDILHQNYAITVTQSGKKIYENDNGYADQGLVPINLPTIISSDPLNVIVTLKGQGQPSNPNSWTGPQGEILPTLTVPEFGTIAILVMVTGFASIIFFSARNKLQFGRD